MNKQQQNLAALAKFQEMEGGWDHGYVMGTVFGDASISFKPKGGRVVLEVTSRSFAECFAESLTAITAIPTSPSLYYRRRRTLEIRGKAFRTGGLRYKVGLYRKPIAERLADQRRPDYVLSQPREFCLGFLAGFFDSDGYTSYRPSQNHLRIGFVAQHKYEADLVCSLLRNIGVDAPEPKTQRSPDQNPVWKVEFGFERGLAKFLRLVGFRKESGKEAIERRRKSATKAKVRFPLPAEDFARVQ